MAIKTTAESDNDKKASELKFDKNKKYMISVTNPDDNRNGFHYCNVNLKEYHVPLNKPIELEEPLWSYFMNSETLTVPGCNLKDESTYVDIEKNTYKTVVKKRFTVTEV